MTKSKTHHIGIVKSTAFLFLLLFTACEEPVEFDLKGSEPRLVVNSNFSTDELFQVWVAESQSPLANGDEYFNYLNDAEVKIYKGNEIVEILDLVHDPTFPFRSHRSIVAKPIPGETYTVRVSAPDYDQVNASDAIPILSHIEEINISNLIVEYPFEEDSANVFFVFDLSIQLSEPQQLPAYFHLDCNYERIPYVVSQTDTIRTFTGEFTSLDLIRANDEIIFQNHFEKGVLFKQEKAGTMTLNFKIRTDPVDKTQDLLDQLYANLRTTSKDYYLYHSTLSRQYLQNSSVLDDPTLIYNNIDGGYGIFAGFDIHRDSIVVHTQ